MDIEKKENVAISENNIDYNMEYMTYKRCFKCQRATPDGEESYKSISKHGKLRTCKTCNKCRGSVASSLAKKRVYTIKEKYKALFNLLNVCNEDKLKELLSNLSENDKEILYSMQTK